MGNFILYNNDVFEEPKREKLYDFFEGVFQISAPTLQKIYDKSFSNHTYDMLAYMDKNKVIANVAVFSLPMLINHTYMKAIGMQCVVSDSECLEKQTVKQLVHNVLEKVDEKYENIFVFTEHPELYKSFGFKVMPQQLMAIPYEKEFLKEASLRKLNCMEEADLQLMQETLEEGQSLSREFSSLNYKVSSYLNMQSNKWNDKLYYSNKLDSIIVYEVVDRVLKLYGVYAPVIPVLDEVCAEITEEFSEIEFYFYPDQLGVENTKMKAYTATKSLMVKGIDIEEFSTYKYPILAEF